MKPRSAFRLIAFATVLLTFHALSPASAQNEYEASETVDEFLELSGLQELSTIFPDSVLFALEDQRGQFDPEIYGSLRLAFESGFTMERLFTEMEAEIGERSTDPHFLAALAWLRGPIVRELTVLEIGTARPENAARIREYGAALELQPPPEARRDLIDRMDRAQGASEAGIKVQMVILRALLEGGRSLQPGGGTIPPEQMAAILENARAQLSEQARSQTLIAMHYTYRDVPGATLVPYVEYWESEEGHWLAATLQAAMLRGLEAASHHTGAFIGLQGVEMEPRN